MIALLAVQSCAQTFIHNAIMLIDISDNASYNQVHLLIRTPYLSIKASNVSNFFKNLPRKKQNLASHRVPPLPLHINV